MPQSSGSPGVDFLTGKVFFSVDLAALKAPNGWGESLQLQYSTLGLVDAVQTWNLDKPTGIVGLGWELAPPCVYRTGHGSITDTFWFNQAPLVCKSRQGNESLGWVLEFETTSSSLYRILYHSATETWTVYDPQGVTYVFGGLESDTSCNTIEWGVRWLSCDGQAPATWVGTSTETSGARAYPVVWRLRTQYNAYNQRIDYRYKAVTRSIGSDQEGPRYTVACYLAEVDMPSYGSIHLFYNDKHPWEYPTPRGRQGSGASSSSNAYQDRATTKYLSRVVVRDPDGAVSSTVQLGYHFLYDGFSSTPSIHAMNKRLLTSLSYLDPQGTPLSAPLLFDYWGLHDDGFCEAWKDLDLCLLSATDLAAGTPMSDPNQPETTYHPLFGHLKSIHSRTGAITYYSYKPVNQNYQDGFAGEEMMAFDGDWANRYDSGIIRYPDRTSPELNDAYYGHDKDKSNWEKAKAYWGDNFVAISWEYKHNKKLHFDIYEWTSGGWHRANVKGYFNNPTDKDSESVHVKGYGDKHNVIAAGAGMLAVVRTDYTDYEDKGDTGAIVLFTRDPYIPAQWNVSYFEHGTKLSTQASPSYGQSLELKLSSSVVGVLDRIHGKLYALGWDGFQWHQADTNSVEKVSNTAASHITTMAVSQDIVVWFQASSKNNQVDFSSLRFDLTLSSKPWTSPHQQTKSISLFDKYNDGNFFMDATSSLNEGYWFLDLWVAETSRTGDRKALVVSWSEDATLFYVQSLFNPHAGSYKFEGEWEVGGVLNHTDEKTRRVFQYQAGSLQQDGEHNTGWVIAPFGNTSDDSDSWARMALSDIVVEATGNEKDHYKFYQYNPLSQTWEKVASISDLMESQTDWSVVLEWVAFGVTIAGDVLVLFGPLAPILASAAEVALAPLSSILTTTVGAISKTAAKFLTPVIRIGCGTLRAYAHNKLLQTLLSGRRNPQGASSHFLLMGRNKDKKPSLFSKLWDEQSQTYDWVTVPLDIDSEQVLPAGGSSSASMGLTADVFAMHDRFLTFSYRSEKSKDVYSDILRTDQICFFQNGKVLRTLPMPRSNFPGSSSNTDHNEAYKHYKDITGTGVESISMSILAGSKQGFPQTSSWGGVLAYMPSTNFDDLTLHKQSDFDSLNFAILYKAGKDTCEGPISDYVVDKVGLNDGFNSVVHFMQYMPQDAYFDNSFGAVLYNQVRRTSGGATYRDSALRWGWQETYSYTPKPLANHAFSYSPDSYQSETPYIVVNQDRTNANDSLNALLGTSYCQRTMRPGPNQEIAFGYEVARTQQFYSAIRRNAKSHTTGEQLDWIRTLGQYCTLEVELTSSSQSTSASLEGAFKEGTVPASYTYTFFDVDAEGDNKNAWRGPQNPNEPSKAWVLSYTAPNGNVAPLNSGIPYAKLQISWERNPNTQALEAIGTYTQYDIGWSFSSENGAYKAFVETYHLTPVQTTVWQSNALTLSSFSSSSNEVPVVDLEHIWGSKSGWRVVSQQIHTWDFIPDVHGAQSWLPASSYTWHGSLDGSLQQEDPSFPWSEPPPSGSPVNGQVWKAGGTLLQHQQTQPTQTLSPSGTLGTKQLTPHSNIPYASVRNASFAKDPLLYWGFESYEQPTQLVWRVDGDVAELDLFATQSFSATGNRSLAWDGKHSMSWSKTFQPSAVPEGTWVASFCGLLSSQPTSSASLDWTVVVSTSETSDPQQIASTSFHVEDGTNWATYRILLDWSELSAVPNGQEQWCLTLQLASSQPLEATMFIDHVGCFPLSNVELSLLALDSVSRMLVSTMTYPGSPFLTRYVFDRRKRLLGKVRKSNGSDCNAESITLVVDPHHQTMPSSFSEEGASQASFPRTPPSSLKIVAQGVGQGSGEEGATIAGLYLDGRGLESGMTNGALVGRTMVVEPNSEATLHLPEPLDGVAVRAQLQGWKSVGFTCKQPLAVPPVRLPDSSDTFVGLLGSENSSSYSVALLLPGGEVVTTMDQVLTGYTVVGEAILVDDVGDIYGLFQNDKGQVELLLASNAVQCSLGSFEPNSVFAPSLLNESNLYLAKHDEALLRVNVSGVAESGDASWKTCLSYDEILGQPCTCAGRPSATEDGRFLFLGLNPTTTPVTPSGQAVFLTEEHNNVVIEDNAGVLGFDADQDFTVECWFQYNVSDDSPPMLNLVQKWDHCYPYILRIKKKTNKIQAARYDGDSNITLDSPHPIKDGKPHHVAFVRDRGYLSLYLDGQLVHGPVLDPTYGSTCNSAPLVVGQANDNQSLFPGQICELRIWRYGRSQEQIKAYKDRSLVGREPGLVGYWPFQENTHDLSRYKQHGTEANLTSFPVQRASAQSLVVRFNTASLEWDAAGFYDGAQSCSPLPSSDGSLLACSSDALSVFDNTLSIQASLSQKADDAWVGLPAVGDGVVAVACSSGALRLLDSDLSWLATVEVPSTVLSSPVVCGALIHAIGLDSKDASSALFSFNKAGLPVGPQYPLSAAFSLEPIRSDVSRLMLWQPQQADVVQLSSGVPSLSMRLGGVSLAWDAETQDYSVKENSKTLAVQSVEVPSQDWLLALYNGAFYFYADGQLVFAEPLSLDWQTDEVFSVVSFDSSVSLCDVIVLYNPIMQVDYIDGQGKTRQKQA